MEGSSWGFISTAVTQYEFHFQIMSHFDIQVCQHIIRQLLWNWQLEEMLVTCNYLHQGKKKSNIIGFTHTKKLITLNHCVALCCQTKPASRSFDWKREASYFRRSTDAPLQPKEASSARGE